MGSLAQALLSDKSFDIEFQGYLSNHVKHAIIALDRLDAPASRLQGYWDEYTKLTPYEIPLHKVEESWDTVKPAISEEWNDWRGKKIHWQRQAAFMDDELSRLDNDTNKLVKQYAPELLSGMAGALTHGVIHLGWAIDAQSPWMICEGLSYLNFCHLGFEDEQVLDFETENDDSAPMDSFIRVANTFEKEELLESWVNKVKKSYDKSFHPELVPAGFQWELSKLFKEPHQVATVIPKWIRQCPLPEIWEELYHAVVGLYLASRDQNGNGNFVVLHLITSLWGLEKTMRVLEPPEEVERKVLGQFYAMTITLLGASAAGFPRPELLEAVHKDYAKQVVDNAEQFDWRPIAEAGIAEKEEHNIKLVYVSRELWRRFGHWKGFSDAAKSFTLTPNIRPSTAVFTA